MKEKAPDMAELAAKLLDLWQDHLNAMASDPEFMRQAGQAWTRWCQQQSSESNDKTFASFFPFAFSPGTTATPGTQTASPASSAGDDDLGKFRDALAALEKRLARLEKKLARRDAATGGPSRKRKR